MIKVVSNAKEAAKKAGKIIKRLETATLAELEDAADKVRRAMAVPGKKSRSPVQWDSDRQRRFVMAKLREEDNLPYKRTRTYQEGWKITKSSLGFFISNDVPYSSYVAGVASGMLPSAQHVTKTGQSHIHEGRWKLVSETVVKVVARLPKRIKERFRITAVS